LGKVAEGGKLPWAPQRLGDPAVTQKYKVRQNAPFKKLKIFSPDAPLENVFPGLRCGSRRACNLFFLSGILLRVLIAQ